MPSRAAKLGEGEVALLVSHRVRIHAKRERRVGVSENLGDPANALARLQCERCPGVARGVKFQRPDTQRVGAAANSKPDPLDVSRVRRRSGFGREEPPGKFRPAALERLLAPGGENIQKLFDKRGRHRDAPGSPTLGGGDAFLQDRAADGEGRGLKVHIRPLKAKRLATAKAGREKENEQRRKTGLVLTRYGDKGLNLSPLPGFDFARLAG